MGEIEIGEFTDALNSAIYGELWNEYKRINNVKVVPLKESRA